MNMLFINQWLTDDIFQAICWTLVHSLWQGLLAAAIAGIIIIGTKRSSAQVRYNLLASLLVLFLATSGITFYRQVSNSSEQQEVISQPGSDDTRIAENTGAVHAIQVDSATAFIDSFVAYLNEHAAFIVLLWAIFFMAKCMKLFSGLLYVHRIRQHKTAAPPENWNQKLAALRDMLGIQKHVRLLQSQLVKMPVAVGFLKPVILVPFGLLSQLPPDQVETILLHELAHIRRKDYLVNLLQGCVETLYFFNPALLWISSLLREEREACCDDIVVAYTTHQSSYLDALVSFQEYTLSSNGYAMALGGKQTYLLNRVKRLLTRENKKLNVMEKIVLLTGLIIIMAFSFIPQSEAATEKQRPVAAEYKTNFTAPTSTPVMTDKKSRRKKAVSSFPRIVHQPDTVPGSRARSQAMQFTSIQFSPSNAHESQAQIISAIDQDGKKYTAKKENGQFTALSINGRDIPANELGQHGSLLRQLQQAIDEANAGKKEQGSLAKIKHGQKLQQAKASQDSSRLDKQRRKVRRAAEQQEKRRLFLIQQDSSRLQKSRNIKQRRIDEGLSTQPKIVSSESKKRRTPTTEKTREKVTEVINDLVQEKIVADASGVESFGLREDQLVVNGQKAPDDIHQKLKAKYGIRSDNGLFFGPAKIYGPGVVVDKKDLH